MTGTNLDGRATAEKLVAAAPQAPDGEGPAAGALARQRATRGRGPVPVAAPRARHPDEAAGEVPPLPPARTHPHEGETETGDGQ